MGLQPKSLRKIINHPCNVVLLHSECHSPGHMSDEKRVLCIEHIINNEGNTNLINYMVFVLEYAPVLKPQARFAALVAIAQREKARKSVEDYCKEKGII